MTFIFGVNSLANYSTLHHELQLLADSVLKRRDCSIVYGHRNRKEQTSLFNAKPPKTKLQYPNSRHNRLPSMAMDLTPYIPGVATYDRKQLLVFGGFVTAIAELLYEEGKMTRKLRWGGDWDMDHNVTDETFEDLAHFELI